MNASFQSLSRHFEQNGWKFDPDPERRLLSAGFEGRHGQFRCVAMVNEAETLFSFLVLVPNRVPREQRPRVAELLARANYGLPLGKFEMDFNDGEVRFHTSSVHAAGHLPDEVIRSAVGNALVTCDRYYPALMSVLYGSLPPEDAILLVEAEDADEEEEKEA